VQEHKHGGFLRRQFVERIRDLTVRPLADRLHGFAFKVRIDYGRMNVALAADRAGIAKACGDRLDGIDDIRLRPAIGIELVECGQRLGGKDGPRPSPEVLGGEIISADLVQVGIDVT